MCRHGGGVHSTLVAHVATAVKPRIGVRNLAPCSRSRHADAIVVMRRRRHVADDEQGRIILAAEAREAEHRVRAVVADDPAKPSRLAVAEMERWLGPVEAIEIAYQSLDTGMGGVGQ